jgi:hypothetical protein
MYSEKVYGVLVKLETTSGTENAPSALTDAVRPVGIPTLNVGYLEPGLRDDVITGRLGVVGRTAPAGQFGTLELTLEMRGAGAAYSASVVPEPHVLLQIAGMATALTATVGNEKYDYWPLDSGAPTATVYAYTAGKLFRMIGCVASVRLSAAALKRGLLTFSITGRIATAPADVSLPALTFNATLPPLFHSALASIGGWLSTAGSDPLVLQNAEIDLANVIADRPSAGATDGLIGHLITDRKPRQTLTYETPQLTSHDPWALSKATGTAQPFTAWQVGTGQYNRFKVATGRWAMEAPTRGANNGLVTTTAAGNLVQGSEPLKGSELLLTFD